MEPAASEISIDAMEERARHAWIAAGVFFLISFVVFVVFASGGFTDEWMFDDAVGVVPVGIVVGIYQLFAYRKARKSLAIMREQLSETSRL
jgi:uncharacterized membrane protein (DUF485 family)